MSSKRHQAGLVALMIPLVLGLTSCADRAQDSGNSPTTGAQLSGPDATVTESPSANANVMPNLIGLSIAQAKAALSSALEPLGAEAPVVKYEYVDTNGAFAPDTVVAEIPADGTALAATTTVIVRVASEALDSGSPNG